MSTQDSNNSPQIPGKAIVDSTNLISPHSKINDPIKWIKPLHDY